MIQWNTSWWAFGLLCSLTACQSQKDTQASIEAVLGRLEHEDRTNAVLVIASDTPDQLLNLQKVDPAQPLYGQAVLVKDNIHVKGFATTAGSLALVNNIATEDASVIKDLRRAGAIIVGKTNLSEWANFRSTSSSSGWSSVGGLTTNPLNASCTACGSSSGSGAAVGSGLVEVALGTETDGSVTCPAAMCGIVGLKPTVGLLATDGVVPISKSQDTVGPMTTTVKLAALTMDALVPNRTESYASALDRNSLQGIRIGVLRNHDPIPDSAEAILYEESLAVLVDCGAVLIDIQEIPGLGRIQRLEWSLLLREFKREINTYLDKTPASVSTRTLAQVMEFNTKNAEVVMPHFGQEIFEISEQTSEKDEPDLKTLAAQLKRLAGTEGIDRLLTQSESIMLVAPTFGRPWNIDLINGDTFEGSSCTTLPAVSGYPHLTVPMGLADGLPFGLSFIGTAFSEAKLLSAGYAFEQARNN
ncbi:MAG: amidase [Phycisphaerae bacterium]|nr:amidase [Phycisphaerae bacterium]